MLVLRVLRAPSALSISLLVLCACTSFGAAPADGDGDGGNTTTPPSSATLDASSDSFSGSATDAFAPNGECLVTFCERFSDPPWSRWTNRKEYDSNNPMILDPVRIISPPTSLRVNVQPRDPWHPTFLELNVAPSKRIVVTASVRVERLEAPIDGEIDVIELEMHPNNGPTHHASIVVTNDGTLNLETRSTDKLTHPIDGGVLNAVFETMALDLDFEAGRARLTRGGGVFVDKPFTQLNKVGGVLRVGAAFANNTKGVFLVNIDDLSLDARP